MKLIAITSECGSEGETDKIAAILDSGFYCVHVRKPHFSDDVMRSYLNAIPQKYLERITLGSHIHLANEFAVGGIHYKSDMTLPAFKPEGLRTSKSCHSIKEVKEFAVKTDYVFLSPIFNSISKCGYTSNFDERQMKNYSRQGLLKNVVALGGITASALPLLKGIGFYGAAFLGYLMNVDSLHELNERLKIIQTNL